MKRPTKSKSGAQPRAIAPVAVVAPPSPSEAAVPLDAESILGAPNPVPDFEKVREAVFAPLVDEGLGAETAMVKAGQIGGALLQHFLSIANDVPKTVKYVLADAAPLK